MTWYLFQGRPPLIHHGTLARGRINTACGSAEWATKAID